MKALYKALASARQQMGSAHKDSTNPHIKNRYASLNSIMDACDDVLFKHGLCYTQQIKDQQLITELVHIDSGESVSSHCPLIYNDKATNPMQAFGGAITYARRYSLQALLGIQADDDDGESAYPRQRIDVPVVPAKKYELKNEAPAQTMLALEWDTLELSDLDFLKRFWAKNKGMIAAEDRAKYKELVERKKNGEASN